VNFFNVVFEWFDYFLCVGIYCACEVSNDVVILP
jgi:hypothetical protein